MHPAVNRAENPYAVEHDDEDVSRQPTPDAPSDRPSEAWRAAFVKQFDGLRAVRLPFPPPLRPGALADPCSGITALASTIAAPRR